MWIIGHRGDPRRCKENTMESFRSALSQGAHGVECDVRMSADGELFLCHDDVWGDLSISQSLGSQLAALGLLKVREILELLPGCLIYFDVKDDDQGKTAEALVRLLPRSWARQVVISSFCLDTLLWLKKHEPWWKGAFLFENLHDLPANLREQTGCTQLHPRIDLCEAPLVKTWLSQGWTLCPWIPIAQEEDEKTWQRLKESGVQGLCTNEPGACYLWSQTILK